jgi:hypothetical protein
LYVRSYKLIPALTHAAVLEDEYSISDEKWDKSSESETRHKQGVKGDYLIMESDDMQYVMFKVDFEATYETHNLIQET